MNFFRGRKQRVPDARILIGLAVAATLTCVGIQGHLWKRRLAGAVAPLILFLALTLGTGLAVVGIAVVDRTAATDNGPGLPAGFYTDIATVARTTDDPAAGPGASTGSWTQDCGRNENGHYNTDNLVISPGLVGGAHHTHDYVGNVSTDALSTDQSLAAAGTTCAGGDRSTYYWPVLRRLDREGADAHSAGGGLHGNTGQIVRPASVRVEFRGSPVTEVVAMPRFLRLVTGDPVASTTNDAQVRAQWGCSGSPGRYTTRYVLCPEGHRPTRTLVFPSCWNGLDTDGPLHRGHMAFPAANGVCPPATFPVPQLRITLAYALPAGVPFALDSFPEQRRDPKTDHALFVNVMTERQMAEVVRCLNEGGHCRPA
jgi:hypothetical protein